MADFIQYKWLKRTMVMETT